MKRRLFAAAFAALPLLALGPTAALAVSPSEQQCIDQGGAFDRVQGQVVCVAEENVGNSPNSQTVTDTATGQGNIGNKQERQCSGPGSSGDSSAHCG